MTASWRPQNICTKNAWLYETCVLSESSDLNQQRINWELMFNDAIEGSGWVSSPLFLYNMRGLWTWPPWVTCAPAFNHKIGNAAHSGVSEVSKSSQNHTLGINNGKRSGQLGGYSSRQCSFEDHQRCANSRWLTDGSDHNRNCSAGEWS